MTYSRATFESGRRPLHGMATSSRRLYCLPCGLCQSGSSTMRCPTSCDMPGTWSGSRLWQHTGDITPGRSCKVWLLPMSGLRGFLRRSMTLHKDRMYLRYLQLCVQQPLKSTTHCRGAA